MNLRGTILPLINVRQWLRLGGIEDMDMVMVVQAASLQAGILAQRVQDVTLIDRDTLTPPDVNYQDIMYGVTPQGTTILNVEAIFSSLVE
jgi:chemotaxis signal transduction protein